MYAFHTKIAAATLSFGLIAFPAAAQVQTGTSGSVTGQDVSAGTSGYGSTDGQSINVGGSGQASAGDGGTAETSTRARTNDRRGMQRSVATARDEDERARSITRTRVRQGEVVDSTTRSRYKARGEPPVREVVRSRDTAKGSMRPPRVPN